MPTSSSSGSSPTRAIGNVLRGPRSMVAALLLACLSSTEAAAEPLPACVYVSSYHGAYGWSDRVEESLRETLGTRCDVISVYLDTRPDTRRRGGIPRYQRDAAAAMDIIEEFDATLVISSDDHAAKYLVVPHLEGSRRPVVFTGINWTVEEYGFPWPNVTGIVEVAPIRRLLRQAVRIVGKPREAVFLAPDVPSAWKNLARVERESQALGIDVQAMMVADMDQFEAAFEGAQQADLLILDGHAGIDGWDDERARRIAWHHTDTLSVTTHDWVMPYTMLGLAKLPEEHGEWAAQSAIAILEGRSPSTIPIATNRHAEGWVNVGLLERGGFEVPASTLRSARHVAPR